MSLKASSLNPTTNVLPTIMVGALRLPVGPNIAATASSLLSVKVVTFLPLATMSLLAPLSKSRASSDCSLRLAGIVSLISTLLASKNLDALVQLVQPLRW